MYHPNSGVKLHRIDHAKRIATMWQCNLEHTRSQTMQWLGNLWLGNLWLATVGDSSECLKAS